VIRYRVWPGLCEILDIAEVAYSVGAAKMISYRLRTYFDFPKRVLGKGFIGL
jgi:hypothetical protein